MGYYETYESKYIFYVIFQIFFQLHAVEFRITFDMRAKIYLIFRKK
jgi:hypothetical protein